MKLRWPLWCKLFHRKPTTCEGPHRWKCGNCGKEWGEGYKYDDVDGIIIDENGRFIRAVLKSELNTKILRQV